MRCCQAFNFSLGYPYPKLQIGLKHSFLLFFFFYISLWNTTQPSWWESIHIHISVIPSISPFPPFTSLSYIHIYSFPHHKSKFAVSSHLDFALFFKLLMLELLILTSFIWFISLRISISWYTDLPGQLLKRVKKNMIWQQYCMHMCQAAHSCGWYQHFSSSLEKRSFCFLS